MTEQSAAHRTAVHAACVSAARVIHTCRGRARLGDASLGSLPAGVLASAAAALADAPGVRDARANALAGSIVVRFDCDVTTSTTLLMTLRQALCGDHSASARKPWHRMTADAVALELRTSETGLRVADARERLGAGGRNTLTSCNARTTASMLTDQIATAPVAILIGAALVSAVTGALLEAIAISAVVGLNAVIGYASEARAEALLRDLDAIEPEHARVLRDGAPIEIAPEEIVAGDVLLIKRGDVIAADARLLETHDLTVSEAALTGESLPVTKRREPIAATSTALAERCNMIFRGTVVTGGSGKAIVVATGLQTEVGLIRRLVATSDAPQTPMQRRLAVLGRELVWLTAAASAVLFVVGLLRGSPLLDLVRSALSLGVAAVPEGLPMIATTVHAQGVVRLGREGVLVRRLNAVETLASVNVICFDKTGTLTHNAMRAEVVVADGKMLDAEAVAPGSQGPLARLLEISCLCSDAVLASHGTASAQDWSGSSTEVALLNLARRADVDPHALRKRNPLVSVQRRSDATRYMATVHDGAKGRFIAVKGDPHQVLSLCTHIDGDDVLDRNDGMRAPMTQAHRTELASLADALSARGLRLLGFAFGKTPENQTGMSEVRDLTWAGLVGLADPVRRDAKEVLRQLRDAGIRAVVLTGDSPGTAQAVADEIGIAPGRALAVMNADDLAGMEPAERVRRVSGVDVLARVSPAQKLEIVRALQAAGDVVAMVGDGINDSPALRAADVGIAIGHGGDAAAREVADIYLAKDELRLIPAAIEQGRATNVAVRRSLKYLLATNSSEVAVVVGARAAGFGEALSPIQLLWLNLATDVLPGIGLALEPPDHALMERGPLTGRGSLLEPSDMRDILRDGSVLGAGAMASGLLGVATYGQGSLEARSMTFASLVGGQLLYSLNCRPSSARGANPALLGIAGGSLLLQGALWTNASTRRLLGLAPIGAMATVATALSILAPFALTRVFRGRASRVHVNGRRPDRAVQPAEGSRVRRL